IVVFVFLCFFLVVLVVFFFWWGVLLCCCVLFGLLGCGWLVGFCCVLCCVCWGGGFGFVGWFWGFVVWGGGGGVFGCGVFWFGWWDWVVW
ncbi:hypothetical protein, partial [Pseudomonas syringae group genomosp. 7]|uniref:hypothetical protein n=1 Tax=Pseudomonas syringae group genomosp. 7 TaxID=251699 RepID=UPI00376F7462